MARLVKPRGCAQEVSFAGEIFVPKIFISYRRQDSVAVAGRIYDRLNAHFGSDAVFMDIDSIPFGEDFREFIQSAVGQCDVLLALIGNKWSGQTSGGARRLDAPRDFVRLEVEAALARDIPIIPVLIDQARMPAESELPASVSRLAYLHAIEVDYGREFHLHVDRLVKGIERLVDNEFASPAIPAQPGKAEDWRPVEEVASPYVVGRPVHGELFVGRRDILKVIEDNLGPSAGKNILVLLGQRRSGKTSVLLRLHETLGSTSKGAYLPVFVDLQGLVLTRDEGQFFHALAHHIWRDLRQHGVVVPKPVLADFTQAPTAAFEIGFLEQVEAALAGRHLLLMLDEFEKVKELIDSGRLSENLLDYFRHLMQHSPLLFLIAGTQKLRELTGGYWSVFFNLALPIDIGVLKKEDAEWLITEPISRWYQIEPGGVSEIIRAAGCHPYFTQLVCRTLLDVRNEGRLSVLTFAHVIDALERALKSGDEQIGYPWTEEDSSPDERLVLAILAHEGKDGSPVAPVTIREEFTRAGMAAPVDPAISRLQMRGVLRQNDRAQLVFTVPLFQKWLVRKSYDSLETATQFNKEREFAAEARGRRPA